MPLFRKKEKAKPSFLSGAFRSVEHLPSSTSSPRLDQVPTSLSQHFPPQTQPHPHPQLQQPHSQSLGPQSHAQLPDSRQPPARHPAHTSLQRSNTQRLRTPPDASAISSTITVVNNSPSPSHLAPLQSFDADLSDQSWPSSPTDKADDQEPRRSKRSLFSFHSSASSSSVRDQHGLLERNISVKRSSTRRHSQQQKQQQQQNPQQPPQQQQSRSSVDIWSREHAVDGPETVHQPSMPQQNTGRAPDPGLAPHTRSPHPSPIPRSNTDPHLFDNLYRQAPGENSRHGDLTPAPHQLDLRPPSRQSIGPPSPFPPTKSETSSLSQLGAMSDRPSGGNQNNQSNAGHASSLSQEASFRNNAGQVGPDTGRATPTSKDNRSRDDLGDIDVRTLLQKHEDLQAKYSKVKRYYFERDAQVQQLQNTVAHQRMAVSRTVLDDNEYANRFGRLDGAIKDLAFSIRKDWKTIPSWLVGYVNEDAPAIGTKEMTAIGRAVVSRWLVDELFERYFHPVLDPAFSQQLKSIEMTLRRQQTNMCTEEDKENAIARISNWRRTTLDGLGGFMHSPAAEEYRTKLIDSLVDDLVATIVTNLHDRPPQGIDNGARMIVENAVGIAEKIPLESRDICVEYIHPGTPTYDITMKIEPGVLPPLPSAAPVASRRSAEDHPEHPTAAEPPADADRDASNQVLDNAPGREQRMRSVFSNIMGRRPGHNPPAGPTPPPTAGAGAGTGPGATEGVRRGSVGGPNSGQTQTQTGQAQGQTQGQGRVRLAAFITAEVRGRGPMNVLVKAPVYPME
ncbi:hypothetical protein BJX99DRAFT_10967 [Aspergillus californicus]